MQRPLDPALLGAVGFAAGCAAAPWLLPFDLAAPATLGLLCFCLRSRPVRVLGWAFVAIFISSAYWLQPAREVGFWELERPLEVVVEVAAEWTESEGDWRIRGRLRRIRQGRRVAIVSLPVGVTVVAAVPPSPARSYRARGVLSLARSYHNDPESKTGSWRLRIKSSRFLTPLEGAAPRPSSWVRRRIRRELALLPESRPGRGLVEALVLGQRRHFPDAWQRALVRLGLAHVLAVSGLHVGLLAAFCWMAARPLPVAPRVFVAISFVWLYAMVVGDRPSVLRAALMVSLALAARLFQRPHSTPNALGLAVLCLLLFEPSLILDLAFQLSVGATAGILFLTPVLMEWWGNPLRWWQRGLAASAAAQIATLPLTLSSFSRLPLLAPALNLLVVPWTSVALAASLVWSAVAVLLPGFGSASSWLLDVAAAPFALPALLPPSSLLSLSLAVTFANGIAVAVGLLLVLRGGWWRTTARLIALTALLLWLSGACQADGTEIVMFDVGQGDSVLLKDRGRGLLIDGGGWRRGDFGGRVLRPALARQGIHRLDAVVVTHPDRDHCGGIEDLMKAMPIDELWSGPGWMQAPCMRALQAALSARSRILWRGDSLRWGNWQLSVIHPPPGATGSRNQRSLVIRAEAHGHRILLTGDVDAAVESELLASGADLESEILKVAHHGSRSSTSDAFLAAVRPRLALVSAGFHNPYGHPSAEVLRRLRSHRVEVLRTDVHGMVRIGLKPGAPLAITVQGIPVPSSQHSGLVRVIDHRIPDR